MIASQTNMWDRSGSLRSARWPPRRAVLALDSMVVTVPTGRTPHEVVEVSPEVLDCGHRYDSVRISLGTDSPAADQPRCRTYYCWQCRTVTYRPL